MCRLQAAQLLGPENSWPPMVKDVASRSPEHDLPWIQAQGRGLSLLLR